MADVFGLPCEDYTDGDERPGIVVAYDLDRVEPRDVLVSLHDHRPGQVLFAHASCWTQPFAYTPDVTTFLYQVNAGAPWEEGRMVIDAETKSTKRSEADTSPVEDLAAKIVAARRNHESVSTTDELAALVRAARGVGGEGAAGLFQASGKRLRQRAGSPVLSNRFT